MLIPESKLVRRTKNPWQESVQLLQDLKSTKTKLHSQLFAEIVSLK